VGANVFGRFANKLASTDDLHSARMKNGTSGVPFLFSAPLT
jgi:hypothetical protein